MLSIEKEIYRERHYSELERRGQINARADAQVSLITLFVGIVAYFALNFPKPHWTWVFVFFAAGFLFLCVGTVGAAASVGWLIWRDAANYLPNPKTDREYFRELVDYYTDLDPVDGPARAEAEIVDELYEDFLTAADTNAKRNDTRDRWMAISKRWVLLAVLGFVIAAVMSLTFPTVK
jgi:hypothetical protein